VYADVDDADWTHERAIGAGAVSLSKPGDRPFQKRTARGEDRFGNLWYLATYTGMVMH
jgi:PhnB protein